MFASDKYGEIRELWEGGGFGGDKSRGDLALCCHLSFWTGRDAGRIERLFAQSRRVRAKWQRDDYRTGTIQKAIAGTRDIYTRPGAPRSGPRRRRPRAGRAPWRVQAGNRAGSLHSVHFHGPQTRAPGGCAIA